MKIRPIEPRDQDQCKELIYAGLREHLGAGFNPAIRHPDLEDISKWYRKQTFLVNVMEGKVIATGALIEEDANTGRIVRMSVRREFRRSGIGRRILDELKEGAKARGFRRLVVETTSSWENVVRFYVANGFEISGYREEDGEVDFVMEFLS